MPDSIPPTNAAQAQPAPDALAQSFAALKTYDRGSGRAALLALDQAVAAASLNDPPAQTRLEQQLVALLRPGASVVAREYICSKLALIGSERSVPALRQLLADTQLATAARNALEALPSPLAAQALGESLPELQGLLKVGALNSLGNRPEPEAATALLELLKDDHRDIAAAALAALGNLGSVKAGEALRDFLPQAPESLRSQAADAALNCAERLLATGQRTAAQALYRSVANQKPPPHVLEAAQRGLRRGADAQ